MARHVERLRELESLLLWEGSIDNGRLREIFGIQSVQASRLLSAFVEQYGDKVRRASAHAPIEATTAFRAMFSSSSADDYLRLLSRSDSDSQAAHIEDARIDLTSSNAQVFATAAQACRRERGLRIFYRSMLNPKGQERLVFPHTIVRVARRWHLRAWCSLRNDFRDFTIGRIANATLEDAHTPQPKSADKNWNNHCDLTIVAHPKLNSDQALMIRAEYFGGATARKQKVRRCLVAYTLQDLRIAINPEIQTPPDFQLHLFNAKEIGPEILEFQG